MTTNLATARAPANPNDWTIAEAFPTLDHLITPCGNQVLVQMRRPKPQTSGGIILVAESRDFDDSMVRVARVLEIGPLAFKRREDLQPWPEGAWVKNGDYVRVPGFAGIDNWRVFWKHEQVRLKGEERELPIFVRFALFNDYDIKGLIKGDPLAVIDYV